MRDDVFPVEWTGRQAVVSLPEHIDISNAGQIREELLSVINRGAMVLIADMTATVSCDHAGAEAIIRAYQRAVVSGTQLRLVVTAPIVRRALSLSGLDRLISIYPSLDGAAAAAKPAAARQAPARIRGVEKSRPAIASGVLMLLLDALNDGIALTDDEGVVTLANRRLEDMFGYDRNELVGRPVESLVPADLRAAHTRDRSVYQRAPTTRPMGARARLVGLRKDGATIPVQITLSPVPTANGQFTLAVVRFAAGTGQRAELVDLARSVAAGGQHHRAHELMDDVVGSLYHVGLSLHEAVQLPGEVHEDRIIEALRQLDDVIHEIRCSVVDPREPGSRT